MKLREGKLRDKVARKIGPSTGSQRILEKISGLCSIVTGDSLKVWVQ